VTTENTGRGDWWCCKAKFGEHEPTCKNYVVPKPQSRVAPTTTTHAAMLDVGFKTEQAVPTGEMFLSGEVARLRRDNERILEALEDDGLKESVAMECSDEIGIVETCRMAIYNYRATVLEKIRGGAK